MYTLSFTIEGTADFLYNRMADEDIANFRAGKNTGDRSDAERGKAAEAKVYADDAGLFVPAWNVKRSILDGARVAGLKLNRKPLAQRLSSVLFVQDVARFVDAKKKPVRERDYMHEAMGRIPPRTGRASIVRRPAMKVGWRLSAAVAVLDDGVPADAIRAALEAAGVYVGIGSWRPEYGRFVVREWKAS